MTAPRALAPSTNDFTFSTRLDVAIPSICSIGHHTPAAGAPQLSASTTTAEIRRKVIA
jgi:hypothetical protein